jgi:nitric oxide reductase large subunit
MIHSASHCNPSIKSYVHDQLTLWLSDDSTRSVSKIIDTMEPLLNNIRDLDGAECVLQPLAELEREIERIIEFREQVLAIFQEKTITAMLNYQYQPGIDNPPTIIDLER